MNVRALEGLRSRFTAPLLRRFIVIICTFAFVLVSFAHGLQHFSGPASATVVQAGLGSFDDNPDPSKKASIAFEHCHGCSLIATAVIAPSTDPDLVEVDLPARKFDQHRPYTRVAETPPPRFAI